MVRRQHGIFLCYLYKLHKNMPCFLFLIFTSKLVDGVPHPIIKQVRQFLIHQHKFVKSYTMLENQQHQ